MKKYEKIPSVFKRDGNTVYDVFSSEYLKQLSNIYWEFTEKIDGTNIRICWDGYDISFLGRTEKSQIPQHLLEVLEKTYKTYEFEEMVEQEFGDKEVIFFGEGCGEKIQTNGAKYGKPHFVLFDIYVDGAYLDRYDFYRYARSLKFETAPSIIGGSLKGGIECVSKHPQSTLGDVEMEGLIARPYVELYDNKGNRIITKIKWKDIKDMEKEDDNED